MIQLTPQMRILVAVEPQDFRRGIDGMAKVCKADLQIRIRSAASRTCFAIVEARRSRSWCTTGRDSGFARSDFRAGRFSHWPASSAGAATPLEAHELSVLLFGATGLPRRGAPVWRP